MAGVTLDVQKANAAELALMQRNLNAVLAAGKIGAKEALNKVAEELLARIKLLLSEPGTGILYYYDKTEAGHAYLSRSYPVTAHNLGIHIASAPGHPPAAWQGIYRRSWSWSPVGTEGPWASVQTAAKIGPYLEYGTRYMMPRPHVRPAVMAEMAALSKTMVTEIVKKQTETIEGLWGSKS
jgi:hypothetical protein